MNYYNYFTEIEEHFVRRRGKHLLVSPMDWSLIATWRDSGVPLHVALRGIDHAMDNFFAKAPRIESKVRSLFYCHAGVMEEYARHLETHLGENETPAETGGESRSSIESTTPDGPDKKEVLEFLNLKMHEIRALLGKLPQVERVSAEGIQRVMTRLEEIARDLETDSRMDPGAVDRDLVILDDTLVGELRLVAGQDLMAEWEKEAKAELKVYRKKLPKETYNKILANFLRTRIHRHFSVGELSLFQM